MGLFGLRADPLVSHLKDALKFLLQAFGQFKGIGLVASPFKPLDFDRIGLGTLEHALQRSLGFVV